MSDLEIDYDLLEDSEPHEEEIPDANPFLITPMIYAAGLIKGIPPQLIDFAGSSKPLREIATNLHTLLTSPGNVKYSASARQDLEQILRAFIFEIVNTVNKSNDKQQIDLTEMRQSKSMLQHTKELLSETQRTLDQQRQQYMSIEKTKEELQNQIDELQEEIETMHTENATLQQKILTIKRESELSFLQVKRTNDSLEEKNRALNDQLRISEFTLARLNNQLESANNESTAIQIKNAKISRKIETKNSKIEQLKNINHTLQLKLRQVETEDQQKEAIINQLNANLVHAHKAVEQSNQNKNNELAKQNNALQAAFSRLTAQFEAQSNEIIQLHQNKFGAVNLIHQQLDLVAYYDENLSKTMSEKQTLQDEATRVQLDEKSTEILDMLQEELNVNSDEEIIEAIREMKQTYAEENERLVTSLENHVRFLTHLVQSGELDFVLLAKDSPPLNSDRDFTEQLMLEIARTKQLVAENTLNGDDRYEFAQASQNMIDLMAHHKVIESIKKEHDEMERILEAIKEIIRFNGEFDEMPHYLSHQVKEFDQFYKKVVDIIQEKPDESHKFDFLIDYLETSTSILQDFDSTLREYVNYDGELSQLPSYTIQSFEDMKSRIDNEKSDLINSLRVELESIKQEFQEENEKASNYISELEAKIQDMESKEAQVTKEYTKIRQQLSEAEEKNLAYEKKLSEHSEICNQFKQAISQSEIDLNVIREENKKLRSEISTKNKHSEARIEKLLQEERAQHKEEIKFIEQRLQVKEDRLQAIVTKKSDRIAKLKSKINEIIRTYDSAFKKQKEAVTGLKMQNDTLALALRNKDSQHKYERDAEVERLTNELQTLQAEKTILHSEIEQLNDKCTRVQQARDQYWSTQLSIQQTKEQSLPASTTTFLTQETPRRKIQILDESVQNSRVLKAADEWEKWARDLYSSVSDGDLATQNIKELRFIISEMVLASMGHRQLIWKLESLRNQKTALMKYDHLDYSNRDNKPKIQGMIAFAISLTRMKKTAQRFKFTGQKYEVSKDSISPRKASRSRYGTTSV